VRCKTAAFATPKRSCHFLRELSLQNEGYVLPLSDYFNL